MGTQLEKCHGCGTLTPVHLLDAKPFAGATVAQMVKAADTGRKFNRLECESCYGDGYVAGGAA
jgi:hypothetical protein